MSVIDEIMQLETAAWINDRVDKLPGRAKYRASSALRSLRWANNIFDTGMPIPACFCALHATEEAVASFISCAKEYGYDNAKMINIKDHAAKATISLLVEKISDILLPFQLVLAYDPMTDTLAVRYVVNGQININEASTKLFQFRDDNEGIPPDFYNELVIMFSDAAKLKAAVAALQEARNNIFYATSTDYPTGFDAPREALSRECKISLALIWAALDITKNEGENIPLVKQALQTAVNVIDELKKK